jgi:hypothetical protein
MSSTNKTSLGLNMWEASDKPVRQDFVNDNVIIDEKISKLNSNLSYKIMSSGNVLTLNRGFYYVYPSCINLPPDTDQAFWFSVNEIDDNNKIIEAVPAGAGYRYFYKAKKSEGVWQGWNKYLESTDLNSKFPYNDRMHLQRDGNIGFTEILKNSNNTADYGTIIMNYMQDGSRTELVINATGIHASKIDSSGNIISSKQIITF